MKSHCLSHLSRHHLSRAVHGGGRDPFPASHYSFLVTPLQELSTLVASYPALPLLTQQAAWQSWSLRKSQLQLGWTSHRNPQAQCREKGWKKKPPIPEPTTKPHQSLRRKTHQLLSSPSTGLELPSILNLENSALRSSAP